MRVREKRQFALNEVIVPQIRKLAETGLYVHEIVQQLGVSRQRVCGLLGQHGIAVRRPSRRKAGGAEPEPPRKPTPDELWLQLLHGLLYEDVVEGSQGRFRMARPLAGSTGETSLAWAG